MGSRAEEVRRFLRSAWWLGILTSTVIAVFAGVWLYNMVEPFLHDVREGHVLTKSDLDSLSNSIATEFHGLATHVGQLEEEVQTMKSDVKPPAH